MAGTMWAIFTWAVAWDELGLPGLVNITAFIFILLVELAWLWIKRGLDWGAVAETGKRLEEMP